MGNKQESIFQYHHDTVIDIFKKKEEFHRQQAQLPIEQKIRILIKLQEIALKIRPLCGQEDKRKVWKI